MSVSFNASAQLGTFHIGVDMGVILGPGKMIPYINYTKGMNLSTSYYGAGAYLNANVFVNGSDEPFALSKLEGDGYSTSLNAGSVSFEYGTGVDDWGIPTSKTYSTVGIGMGSGFGIYGNFSITNFLIH